MKNLRFLFSVLFLGAMATTASAQGAVSISWDSCTGPVDKHVIPGPTASVYASVVGHSQVHQAYQVWIRLGPGWTGGPLRDAWRFDAAGCQGSSFLTINHLNMNEVSKACPTFQGVLWSVQLKEYQWDELTGRATTYLANTYPAGNNTQIDPSRRYFLAHWMFDHSRSVEGATTPGANCGGLEVPMCVQLTRASWLTLGGVEIPWLFAQENLRSRNPENSIGCPGAVPAENRTWGALKAQYKR